MKKSNFYAIGIALIIFGFVSCQDGKREQKNIKHENQTQEQESIDVFDYEESLEYVKKSLSQENNTTDVTTDYFALVSEGIDPISVSKNGNEITLESQDQVKEMYREAYTNQKTGEFNQIEFDKMYQAAAEQTDFLNNLNYDNIRASSTYKINKAFGIGGDDPVQVTIESMSFMTPTKDDEK